MRTDKNRRRAKRRKQSRLKKALGLIVLLWLMSLSLTLFVASSLYAEIEKLQTTNTRLALQLASVQERAESNATREELQQVHRQVDQQGRRLEQLLAPQQEREFQLNGSVQFAGARPLTSADLAVASDGAIGQGDQRQSAGEEPATATAWYVAVANGAADFGSRVLSAMASMSRLHPAIP